MSGRPRRLSGGERVTATAYNALLDYCCRCLPIAGRGVAVSRGPGGSLVSVSALSAVRGASAGEYGAFRWKKGTGHAGEGDDRHPVGTISFCNYQFGRAVYTIVNREDIPYADVPRDWFLAIPHDHPEQATITDSPDEMNEDRTVIPLFGLDTKGNIVKDYRGMPVVPVWGSRTA